MADVKMVKMQQQGISLLRDLIVLSRFHKYNPIFACFAGAWSSLLAGAAKLGEEQQQQQDGLSSELTTPAYIFRQTGLVFLSAYIFCGAGMVWNDWIDRDIDAHVARTKDRPLAARRVTTAQAMVWMAVQIAASWWVLDVALEGKDVWKHMLPAIVASFLYPFGKRPLARKLRIYPQYILGFVIAWPAVPGWAAVYGPGVEAFGATAARCLPLCVTTFFWTIYLNTAYSYQDVVDDRRIGVNSLYNLAGLPVRTLLCALVAPVAACLPLALRAAAASPWLWASWAAVWLAAFARQLAAFDAANPASGGGMHKENFVLGAWAVVACAVEVAIKYAGAEKDF